MDRATFCVKQANEVERAVMAVFGCEMKDIIQYKDTDMKKVVVFILYKHFEYDWHYIGRYYQMTYLYVPTVAELLAVQYKNNADFSAKIDNVLQKVNRYAA